MKLLLVCLGLLSSFNLFSQGVVAFRNDNLSSPPDRLIRNGGGGPLVGTNFIAQLTYGTIPASLTPHPVVAYFREPTTSRPGTWVGGSRTLTGVGGVGTTIYLAVRMWDGNAGATFDQARAAGGLSGTSRVFQYMEGLSTPPNPAFDTAMHNFAGFGIPEPSAALLAAPVCGLLWSWRKKMMG